MPYLINIVLYGLKLGVPLLDIDSSVFSIEYFVEPLGKLVE